MAGNAAGTDSGAVGGAGVVDGTDDANLIDPPNGAGTGATDPSSFDKRGRGRPKLTDVERTERAAGKRDGTDSGAQGREKSSAGRKALDIGLFATQIVGFHKLLVLATKNELWAVSENEAKNLAVAISDVLSQHKMNISPTTVAYVKLLMVGAAVYGPRLAMMQKQANHKAQQEQQTQ